MDFRQAVSIHVNLPPENRDSTLSFEDGVRLNDQQRANLAEELHNDVFLLGEHCYTILCVSSKDWYLVPLKHEISTQFRQKYLIEATHLHFTNYTLH